MGVVARLAVDAVLVVDEELLLPHVIGVVDHLVHGGRAEALGGVPVLLAAQRSMSATTRCEGWSTSCFAPEYCAIARTRAPWS
jgi:hypothetical protein